MEAMVNGKADAWRRRIDNQRASGQSVRAWCEANDAQEGSFYWWRARLGLSPGKQRLRRPLRSAQAKPTPLAFAQVVVHPPTAEPLRLRFAGGHELILPASMPIEQVARLVHAIESTT
jgi:hypothetical protein